MIRRWILSLGFVLLAPGALGAQSLEDYDYENLTFRGIGFDVGYIWPNRVEATPIYTVRTDLGFLGPHVRIVPSIGFWSSSLDRDELARLAEQLSRLDPLESRNVTISPDELGTIRWSDLFLALDGHYIRDVVPSVQGYVGAALGLHFFNGSGRIIDDTFVEDLLDSVTAGLSLAAGFEAAPHDRLRVHVEGRYTLLDDVRYPGVHAGVTFLLPSRQAEGPAAVPTFGARR